MISKAAAGSVFLAVSVVSRARRRPIARRGTSTTTLPPPFTISVASPGTRTIGTSPALSRCVIPARGSAELHYLNGITNKAAIGLISNDTACVGPLKK
jgi:hypothetical protein